MAAALLQQIKDDLDAKIVEDNIFTNQLDKIEKATDGKVKRADVVYGAIGLTSVYLVFGRTAELVCNMIGSVYPAYESIIALQTDCKDHHTEWLTYWVIFGFLQLLTFWAHHIMRYFPVFWLAKSVVFLWLYLPETRGALIVYRLCHALKLWYEHSLKVRQQVNSEVSSDVSSEVSNDDATIVIRGPLPDKPPQLSRKKIANERTAPTPTAAQPVYLDNKNNCKDQKPSSSDAERNRLTPQIVYPGQTSDAAPRRPIGFDAAPIPRNANSPLHTMEPTVSLPLSDAVYWGAKYNP